MLKKLIDLSQVVDQNTAIYPGDQKTELTQTKFFERDEYNVHQLNISMHAGTHVDSPMHMTDSNEYIYQMGLEHFVGNGCLLDVRGEAIIQMKQQYHQMVKPHDIVLLYTAHDKYYGTDSYYSSSPVLDMELCEFLIDKEIKILGMDMPSPDAYPYHIHKALFKNRICIIENLTNLEKLAEIERFEVFAFPLKVKADSSIVRVVAREL